MTETPQLPPELDRLERDLAERLCPGPSTELRDRVIRTVEGELGHAGLPPAGLRRAGLPSTRASGWLAFAVSTAAAVLIWVNLSLSAAQATSYDLRIPAEPHSLDATARQIRELVPEMSKQEARRHAVLLHGGADLVDCPSVAAPRRKDRASTWMALFPQGE